ncbi:hypothetical protein [Sphingomonas bacterium]|uniref:hypothetical protein n=1 Tax=Sphingomonas bacterium TaxID=1895847 RepID=UPI0015770027|nr:hypothetical protein [Sphingomonas bacterium]
MKIIAIAVAAASLATAGTAVAQYGPRPGQPAPWNAGSFWRGAPENPYQRIQFLQDRVNQGMANGSLDRREAHRVNGELNGVRQWIQRMHWRDAGNLSPDQRAQVQGRLDNISRQIRWMRHDGW